MKYVPLDFDILLNPFNWVIVWLMIAVAYMGLALVFPQLVNKE